MDLQVQTYLRSGKTLVDLKTELGIESREWEDLVILNYNQIESPKTHPIVQECRQLILRKNTWDIVFMSFQRFFNYGENLEETKDFDFANAVALSKIDGCCDADTILETEDGPKTIKEICEHNYSGKVKCFDLDLMRETMCAVEAVSVQKNNDDWYEIELEDGTTIKLTGNHKVYLPEIGCYREVKNLKGDEEVFLVK